MFDKYAKVHGEPNAHEPYRGQYANPHVAPEALSGPADARPTALQIVEDNDLVDGLNGKVALITGCSSGLGIETARAMKATGAKLFVTARDRKKGEDALKDILEPGKVELLDLDLNSLDSVRKCAKELLTKTSTLNIVINNAGIMAVPERTLTADGFEAQFGTNHLAHFLLFQLLKPTLLNSATPDFASRVVCVSSSGHRRSGVQLDDLQLAAPGAYDPWKAYGQSKTSNIYMGTEIERRYGSSGIHGHALHPGGIWTGLQIHMDTSQYKGNKDVERSMKSPEQGAATQVWAAIDKEWEGNGGKYLDDCQVAGPLGENPIPGAPGYAAHAYDTEAAMKLWTESCKLVGVEDD